jgi:hypothetical protein
MKKDREVKLIECAFGGQRVRVTDQHGHRRTLSSVDVLPKNLRTKVALLDAATDVLLPDYIKDEKRLRGDIPELGMVDVYPDGTRVYYFTKATARL